MSLSDHVRVDIGSVVASTGVATADNCLWLVTDVEGWDAPDMRGVRSDPTARPGSYLTGAMHGGRIIRVHGLVEGATREDAWAAYYRCTGSLPGLFDELDFVVYETPTKSLTVRQAEPPAVSAPVNASFTFTLALLAEYPYKRLLDPVTESLAAGATASFTASGNIAAEIEVTTTSAGTVVLSASGQTLRTSSLPSGSVLTSGPGFTNPERTVRGPDGSDLFGATLSPMQWPAMEIGTNPWVNAGTADVDITYYPTYA